MQILQETSGRDMGSLSSPVIQNPDDMATAIAFKPLFLV